VRRPGHGPRYLSVQRNLEHNAAPILTRVLTPAQTGGDSARFATSLLSLVKCH